MWNAAWNFFRPYWMCFETEVGLKTILHPDHHAALKRQSMSSFTEDPTGLSKSVIFCVLSETPVMLYVVKRKGENSTEDQNSLLQSCYPSCCQSRRSNSSKSAQRKFGSFSVYPLLPHVGRTSGPLDKDGADVFSFSAALTEWFWWHTAHPERCVCALESSGITERALMEESWVQEALGHSIIFWAAIATWQKHDKYNWSFLVV